MKEKLYTIPLGDAFHAHDECPFCFIERKLEQDLLDFLLGSGSSYMESDVRATTDSEGFCQLHLKKMFDYGNTLGNGWILKTHYEAVLQDMKRQFKTFESPKTPRFGKKSTSSNHNSIVNWITQTEESCYVCKRLEDTFNRYLDTFFYLYKTEEEFRATIAIGKGFCLTHYKDLCAMADTNLQGEMKSSFYQITMKLMEDNMTRMSEDVSWLVAKFDYLNRDADWKNSKDAVQRSMQKLRGGYPADGVYQSSR